MPALVTVDDVLKILPDEFAGEDLSTFISTADLLVTEELASTTLSTARKTQIELYLAAHLAIITLEKGGLTRRRIGDSEDYFQMWTTIATGLQATRYGQQVAILDTSGVIAALGSGKLKAQFRVVSPNPARCPSYGDGYGYFLPGDC